MLKAQEGVVFNVYPDSIGENLSALNDLFEKSDFKHAFSYVYLLPTLFNSDLDRGFSIIDYNLNQSLVKKENLEYLANLNINLKLDIVLNHLSVASPQFQDLLLHGNRSHYKDFFINWNSFWTNNGQMQGDGIIMPKKAFLEKLFMRKDGLPILEVFFSDGSKQPYWNTFYQKIEFNKIKPSDLDSVLTSEKQKMTLSNAINDAIDKGENIQEISLIKNSIYKSDLLNIIYQKCTYLGQMDLNANSEMVWEFYQESLQKLNSYGCKILRLDAFAYLHKSVGETNFFNKPGTWEYLERFKSMADEFDFILLPEIHAEYGSKIHEEIAKKGYMIYDFFLPGLMIYSIEYKDNSRLIKWITEIIEKGYKTINMLGCHDGIPMLDLRGKEVNGVYHEGLLTDRQIDDIIALILDRGGKVKNIFDTKGKKISYYQINATYFSALGESEKKLLMARAIQLFMPGTPQVWYLDLFAGKNDYLAMSRAGTEGHKEINRTNLSIDDINEGLTKNIVKKQLALINIRNRLTAFGGQLTLESCNTNQLKLTWKMNNDFARLEASLDSLQFSVSYSENGKLIKEIFNS